MVAKKPDYTIYPLPCGVHPGATVVKTRSMSIELVKLADGRVCNVRNRGFTYVTSNWTCNDFDRKAYAKLVGIKFSDIKKEMQRIKRLREKHEISEALGKVRQSAEKLGYVLTKKPEKKA